MKDMGTLVEGSRDGEKHNKYISFMLKDGEGLSKFYKNKNIKPVLEYVLTNNEDIIMLMNAIPFYSSN